mmetsp:Transcript_92044/g.257270  ORF Transcript_92044/g.257270 Transcript_92044/m.257270 type:complete len:319 (+) Transcript_92044:738-1694(+)
MASAESPLPRHRRRRRRGAGLRPQRRRRRGRRHRHHRLGALRRRPRGLGPPRGPLHRGRRLAVLRRGVEGPGSGLPARRGRGVEPLRPRTRGALHRLAVEGLLLVLPAGVLGWRVAVLRSRAHGHRPAHHGRLGPRRTFRLRARHPRHHHRHHLRGAGDLHAGPLRLENRRGPGPHRGRLHRQRHGEQLGERVPRHRAALDHRLHLLVERRRHGGVEIVVWRCRRPLPGRRLRGEERRLVFQRRRLHRGGVRRARPAALPPAPPRRRVGRRVAAEDDVLLASDAAVGILPRLVHLEGHGRGCRRRRAGDGDRRGRLHP